jgi:hypothetical protein
MSIPAGNPPTRTDEQLFKKLNDKYYEAAEKVLSLDEQRRYTLGFYCECPDTHCRERVNLRLSDYRDARGLGHTYIVHSGHETATERVVEDLGDYTLVAKKLS